MKVSKHNILVAVMAILSSAFLLGSCQRIENAKDSQLSFLVSAKDVVEANPQFKSSIGLFNESGENVLNLLYEEGPTSFGTGTKATQINGAREEDFTDNGFGIYGFKSSGTKLLNGVKVELTATSGTADAVGTPVTPFYWEPDMNMSFVGYYPYGETRFGSAVANGAWTFNYAVPTSSSDQKDLMLAYYKGLGVDGVAELVFSHPLTTVTFRAGDIEDILGDISSIKMQGVYEAGTCTATPSPANHTYTYSWVPSGTQTVTGTDDDFTFIIIPQDLEAQAVTLYIDFSSGECLTTTLDSGIWKAGHTNRYVISFRTGVFDFRLNNTADANKVYNNTTSDAPVSVIPIVSEYVKGSDTSDPGWNIHSYQVGSEEPVIVDADSFTNGGGLDVEKDGSNLKITSLARTSIDYGSHSYWTGDNGDWSPESWIASTASSPVDLSKLNFQTGESTSMNTANCYIVRHAGTYMIPLVYGNGVENGIEYVDSYQPQYTVAGTRRLSTFFNHLSQAITSAFIENNADCVANSCDIVWQDKAQVVSNLSIVAPVAGGSAGSYDASNVRYLKFTVGQDNICQNNALIAVKDGNGKIMWSWHIWITNDPAVLEPAIEITNHDNKDYELLPLNCLGQVYGDGTYPENNVKLVLKQAITGYEIAINVKQKIVNSVSSGMLYQFGRKDPISSVSSKVNHKTSIANAIQTPDTFYSIKTTSADEDAAPYNWFSGTGYYNLWSGKYSNIISIAPMTESSKTIYDPSPAGYKVPDYGAFSGFTTTGLNSSNSSQWNVADTEFNKGFYFYSKPGKTGELIFFPAIGNREWRKGNLDGVGQYSMYWCSVVINSPVAAEAGQSYAGSVYFRATFVYPKTDFQRATAAAVRPIKEY